MATDGQASFVFFIYSDIQWGIANIGFSAGDGVRFFMVPGALTSQTRNIENGSNVNVSGLYIYRVDQNTVFEPGTFTIDISLERSFYFVNESSGFVEVCAVLRGLGVAEGIITVDILTESISATGSDGIIDSGSGSGSGFSGCKLYYTHSLHKLVQLHYRAPIYLHK